MRAVDRQQLMRGRDCVLRVDLGRAAASRRACGRGRAAARARWPARRRRRSRRRPDPPAVRRRATTGRRAARGGAQNLFDIDPYRAGPECRDGRGVMASTAGPRRAPALPAGGGSPAAARRAPAPPGGGSTASRPGGRAAPGGARREPARPAGPGLAAGGRMFSLVSVQASIWPIRRRRTITGSDAPVGGAGAQASDCRESECTRASIAVLPVSPPVAWATAGLLSSFKSCASANISHIRPRDRENAPASAPPGSARPPPAPRAGRGRSLRPGPPHRAGLRARSPSVAIAPHRAPCHAIVRPANGASSAWRGTSCAQRRKISSSGAASHQGSAAASAAVVVEQPDPEGRLRQHHVRRAGIGAAHFQEAFSRTSVKTVVMMVGEIAQRGGAGLGVAGRPSVMNRRNDWPARSM